MIQIRLPRVADAAPCTFLAADVVGEARAPQLIRAHLEQHHLMVADADNQVVGLCAWRTDWFQCSFVSLVVVHEDFRRKGIARHFYEAVEAVSPSPRLYSSAEETNAVSIRMHAALGFQPSGHIDNLPQGCRELLFYKRIPPRLLGPPDEAAP
jgi:GNAT superfamily N-acetyltransferase